MREDPGIETLIDLHGQIIDHKHRHVSDKGVPYEFQNAQQLLVDFFDEVDRVLKEIKKK